MWHDDAHKLVKWFISIWANSYVWFYHMSAHRGQRLFKLGLKLSKLWLQNVRVLIVWVSLLSKPELRKQMVLRVWIIEFYTEWAMLLSFQFKITTFCFPLALCLVLLLVNLFVTASSTLLIQTLTLLFLVTYLFLNRSNIF